MLLWRDKKEEQIIGAAWCRIMDDYGHWEKDIPSLAMAVLPAYRGKGLGSQLLYRALQRLQALGYVVFFICTKTKSRRTYVP